MDENISKNMITDEALKGASGGAENDGKFSDRLIKYVCSCGYETVTDLDPSTVECRKCGKMLDDLGTRRSYADVVMGG